jgi:RNA polymerase sigma factor (sigma-70 family)
MERPFAQPSDDRVASLAVTVRRRTRLEWTRPASLPRSPLLSLPVIDGEALARLVTEAELDYSAFFRAEFAPVLRTVTLILRDQSRAEEITQDAFIQLLHNWPKISRYERPQAWVRRVAVRLAMRAIRRDRLWALVRLELLPSAAAPATRFDLPAAIGRLPGSQRAAIVLHYYEDRPVAEVAMILGCAESTARVHLHRGRERLRELLGEDDDVV